MTLGGPIDAVEAAARRVVELAVARIDLRNHTGVHPRLGAADVVPFVPLGAEGSEVAGSDRAPLRGDVVAVRDRFADWAGEALALPCFLYGQQRTLPEVRRAAFRSLGPDAGPAQPHPSAGATAVGARPVLVAYNLWIEDSDAQPGEPDRSAETARALAAELRRPGVRSLGLIMASGAQVSFNVTDPGAVSLALLHDAVANGAGQRGCSLVGAELVGLVPQTSLDRVPRHRWAELDLAPEKTIEARMAAAWPPSSRRTVIRKR